MEGPPRLTEFPATAGLLALILVMFGVEVLLGGSTETAVLLRLGANYAPLVDEGQAWRLLSSALLHIGPFHLLMNSLALWQLGRFCEVSFGSGWTLALFVLTAITGSVLAYAVVTGSAGLGIEMRPRISAGASGAIFGLGGGLVSFFLRHRERLTAVGKALLRQLLVWSALMMAFSFVVPGIDWMAHLGGLAGGFAVGWALPRRERGSRLLAGLAAGIAAVLLVLATLAMVTFARVTA